MKGLEAQGCRNSTSLRRLRLFVPDPSPRGRGRDRHRGRGGGTSGGSWRFYMEYCAHGTLHDLIAGYREHNRHHPGGRGRRVPEAFVWQAFRDLAHAAHHMSTLRFDRDAGTKHRGGPGDTFVLHLDLKHENGEFCPPGPGRGQGTPR